MTPQKYIYYILVGTSVPLSRMLHTSVKSGEVLLTFSF